jgi:hypothetical protein
MAIVPRPPSQALPFALAALAVVAWIGAAGLAVRRNAENHHIGEAARQAQLDVEQALSDTLSAVTGEARLAAELRPLRAALDHQVDAATFRDLLVSEEWWAPFRERLVLVVGPDGQRVDSGGAAAGLADGELLARARTTQPAAGWVGSEPLIAAAAVPVRPSKRTDAQHVLVLGRPFDRAGLDALAARLSLGLVLSDGRSARLVAGHPQGQLADLVGRERQGVRRDRFGRWVAVPLSLRASNPPGRWLWAVRDLSHQPAWATWLAPAGFAAAGLFTGAAALIWFRRRRRRRRPGGPARLDLPVTGTPLPGAELRAAGMARPDQPTLILDGQAQAFGRYTLLERIGEGGMSELFTAVLSGAEGFRRLYVVKRLKPHIAQNKDAVDQFIDEAKLGSLLVHSNIVPVFDFGKVGSGYFLAQEYITGRNLVQVVQRHQERLGEALALRHVLYVAHEVLEALAYAHERVSDEGQWLSIVHRDVSSSNIMVTAQGEVKLFDFGIVSASERLSSTEIGRIKGNAAYMSPEQARGQPVDGRSDLFSLGMVMFSALTGETLYGTQNPAAAFYEATAGLNADHLARIRALPDPMPALLEKALAMDPDSRFSSARDFAEAIAPYAAGMKSELATLMNALFGEDLRRQTAAFRAKLGTMSAAQKSS